MKMDPSYIRKLLIAAESVSSPSPDIKQIASAFFDVNDKPLNNIDDNFILHYELLFDYGFLEPLGSSSGIHRAGDGGHSISVIPLRITAHGHEFIAALEKENVWEVIKTEFKEESLDTIFTLSKQLAVNFAKEKLGKYLDDSH